MVCGPPGCTAVSPSLGASGFVMPLLPDCFEKTISEHKILLSVLPLNSASSSSGSQSDLQMSVMKCTEDGAGIFCGLLSGLFV